jgi:hypothetical protein
MQLLESKSLLAKLMATENLIVEQRKVQTASFDVKNRVLVIPQLDKNISGYLYDMFVGHEVGHALYTPLDGMTKAYEMKVPQSITNCVEDSRIERKIKNKYPGIRASFVKGYKDLIDKDFFGTQGVDLNTLGFLDRLNMFTKGGPSQGIKFTDVERELVELVESTETYDEVIEVSKKIAAYVKAEKEAKRQKMAEEGVEEDEELDEFEEHDFDEDDENGEFGYNDFDGEDGEESETDLSKEGEGSEDEDEDESGEDDDKKSGSTNGTSSGRPSSQDDEIRSLTDDAYKQNESKLFEQNDSDYYYGNIPKIDLDRAIFDYKALYKTYREEMDGRDLLNVDDKPYQKLRSDANKVVSYLAKEFELRKNADQMKRASTAKTGELNMNKIFSYKFNDDIFKKITVLPGGKSHGLVMFLDWSGSMSNHIENTVKQLISLVMFCKKVNIPYEVYAFTSEYDTYSPTPKKGDIALGEFRLLNVLSSRMSAVEFSFAAKTLVNISLSRYCYSRIFSMGGTPLNEAVISAMQIVPEFQKRFKLQVVNTIFLTDGEGHRINKVYYETQHGLHTYVGDPLQTSRSFNAPQPKLIARDTETKNQVIVNQYKNTASYLELLKARTNCNIVGFYVLSGREFTRAAYGLVPKAADLDALRIQFRKEKSLVITSAGFDEYYLLRSEALDTDDDVEFSVKENATTRGLVSAFSKYTKNRLMNRVILNRFIGMIA